MDRHRSYQKVRISGHKDETFRVRAGETVTITGTGSVEPTAAGAIGVLIPQTAGGAKLTNHGIILGGIGKTGHAHGTAGMGGIGLDCLAAASMTNTGTIAGGAGGTGGQGGNGGAGVYLDGGTLINAGTIAGGAGGLGTHSSGVAGDAVRFGSSAATLVIDPGAVFMGAVTANIAAQDVLDLAGTSPGTLSGLGTQFSGFAVLKEDAGASWDLNGPSAIGAQSVFTTAGTLTIYGALAVSGTLANTGLIYGASYRDRSGLLAVDVTGGTLTNGGDIIGGAGGYGTRTYAPEGGNGVDLTGGTLTNTGRIVGGHGGSYAYGVDIGGTGGVGVNQSGGAMANSGLITGGSGGTDDYFAGSGIVSGDGVDLSVGLLSNTGTIAGGGGSYGRDGDGGQAGNGVVMTGGTLTNSGLVAGGAGGPCYVGYAGNGGIGVILSAGVLLNQGTIAGGLGGFGSYAVAGNGGAGVVLLGGQGLTNQGLIAGGNGAYSDEPGGAAYSGSGGAGLIFSGGTVTNSGTIVGGNGGYASPGYGGGMGGAGVVINGGTLLDYGAISGGAGGTGPGTPGMAGDAVLFGANSGTLEITAAAAFQGDIVANPAAYDLLILRGSEAGTLAGLGTQITGFSVISEYAGSTWTLTGSDTVGAATVFAVGGELQIADAISFLGAVEVSGTIDVAGTLTVGGPASGFGTMAIGSAATLSLLATSTNSLIVDFQAGTGVLNLGDAGGFAATIAGFGGGDAIDLLNTPETGFSYGHDVLTVTDNGQTVASLRFEGSYTKSDFSLSGDGHGGTVVTLK